MNIRALLPGLVAGVVYLLLSPHQPWGRSFPHEVSVQAWMAFLKSWVDHLGVLLSLAIISLVSMPRLRDREVRVAVFLWLAAGSAMHAGPPMGMAMLGFVLIWSVVVSGERAVNPGAKGALGAHLMVLGAPSLTLAAAPVGIHLLVDRLGQRKELILLAGWLALGGVLIWHFDLISRNRFIYLWSEFFYVWDQPLKSWLTPLFILLSDPVLVMAFPGTFYLGRIGASTGLRISIASTAVIGLLGALVTGAPVFFVLAPVLALSVGSFLDREIAARSLWYGVVLGSVAASVHSSRFQSFSLDLVQPWWLQWGLPSWLGALLQFLVLGSSLFLIVRSALRVGGFQARLTRVASSIGVAILTAVVIAAAHRLG